MAEVTPGQREEEASAALGQLVKDLIQRFRDAKQALVSDFDGPIDAARKVLADGIDGLRAVGDERKDLRRRKKEQAELIIALEAQVSGVKPPKFKVGDLVVVSAQDEVQGMPWGSVLEQRLDPLLGWTYYVGVSGGTEIFQEELLVKLERRS